MTDEKPGPNDVDTDIVPTVQSDLENENEVNDAEVNEEQEEMVSSYRFKARLCDGSFMNFQGAEFR